MLARMRFSVLVFSDASLKLIVFQWVMNISDLMVRNLNAHAYE